jgi:hypothetical protein
MNIIEKDVQARLDQLKKEREDYIRQANLQISVQVGIYDGGIFELEKLLKPGPEAGVPPANVPPAESIPPTAGKQPENRKRHPSHRPPVIELPAVEKQE